jgi:hypothetical protein
VVKRQADNKFRVLHVFSVIALSDRRSHPALFRPFGALGGVGVPRKKSKNRNKQIHREFERVESKKWCSEFYVCFETVTLEHSFLTFNMQPQSDMPSHEFRVSAEADRSPARLQRRKTEAEGG